MMKNILFLFLFVTIFFNNLSAATNSDLFLKLETDSLETKEFINQENGLVNNALKINHFFKPISIEMEKIFNIENILVNKDIGDGQQLKIIDLGLGKPLLIKIVEGASEKIIFSSFKLSRKGYYQYKTLSLSPDKKYFALTMYYKGSIDDFYLVFGDLDSGEIYFEKQVLRSNNGIFWLKNNQVVFNDPKDLSSDETCRILDLQTKEQQACVGHDSVLENSPEFMRVAFKEETFILDQDLNKYRDTEGVIDFENIFKINSDNQKKEIFYSTMDFRNDHDVVLITKAILSPDLEPVLKDVITIEDQIFESMKMLDGYFLILTKWGLNRSLFVFKDDGTFVSKIILPIINTIEIKEWNVVGSELFISLKSLSKVSIVSVKLDKPEVTLKEFSEGMDWQGMNISIESILVPSFDGTLVPIQIIKDQNFKGALRPAFIQAYGGFNLAGYLFATSSKALTPMLPFLTRGGMIVNTGVRGGNEFGNVWHTSAMKQKKTKTFEDVASVAKYLIDKNLSKKEMISLFGSSNGGYVSATTGLLYPQYFGLIIPHAGVLDQLAKERLDKRFGGWRREYLSESIEEEKKLIPSISPLELALGPINTDFLILAGRSDSRVNPAHSYKLGAALKKVNVGKTYLYSIKNNGHFELSPTIGEYASRRDWSIIWSTVLLKSELVR